MSSPGILILKGLAVGALGAVVVALSDPLAAAGVGIGGLAAGLYAWGYLRSHLAGLEQGSEGRSRIIRKGGTRLVLLAVAGFAVSLLGRTALIGFLGGFAGAFALVLATEAGRIRRRLKGAE